VSDFTPSTELVVTMAGDFCLVGNVALDQVFAKLAMVNSSATSLATGGSFQPLGLISLVIYHNYIMELRQLFGGPA
jgi:hypothetical protein